jgi:murein DD-endopeptidase MepM/ murein hydrolase activator NlpD
MIRLLIASLLVVLLVSCGESVDSDAELASEEACGENFCMIFSTTDSGVDVSIKTEIQTAVSLKLEFELEGMTSSVPLPYQGSFRGAGTTKILTISKDTGDGPWSYRYNYTHRIGLLDVTHDDSVVYRIPYNTGEAYVLTQGYNGSFSHMGESALDFNLPEGTEVRAARAGTVVRTRTNFILAGLTEDFKDKANLVTVVHIDGSIGEYIHLQQGGVVVNPGDSVIAGSLLGYSGNTGFSEGSHLHFHVSRNLTVDIKETISVSFKTETSDAQMLEEGQSYIAADL